MIISNGTYNGLSITLLTITTNGVVGIIGGLIFALIQITTFKEKLKKDYDNSLKTWFKKVILNKNDK